jgi:hypothetical protein
VYRELREMERRVVAQLLACLDDLMASDMSDFSSASDRDGDLDELETNTANDQMMAVYMKQPLQQNKRKRSRSDEGEKELINISSDDDTLKT